MVITSLQLLPSILAPPTRNGCTSRRLRMAVVVSCRLHQSTDATEARLIGNISRRDTLSYISSAFLATFMAADRAEARTSRQENKRKVREKLEKLREKALGPKEKNGDAGEKDSVANLLIPRTLVEASI